MKQKVIKIGSSIGVVLPKPVADELGFKAGQEISLYVDKIGKNVIVSHWQENKEDIGKLLELIRWTDETIEKHRPLFERLKDR